MPDGDLSRCPVVKGQLWRDGDSHARVYGVVLVDRVLFAVMRRTPGKSRSKRRRPFLLSVPSMIAGHYGWRFVPE